MRTSQRIRLRRAPGAPRRYERAADSTSRYRLWTTGRTPAACATSSAALYGRDRSFLDQSAALKVKGPPTSRARRRAAVTHRRLLQAGRGGSATRRRGVHCPYKIDEAKLLRDIKGRPRAMVGGRRYQDHAGLTRYRPHMEEPREHYEYLQS